MKKHLLKPVLPTNANIKVIGLGGVGSIVARYSAVFLASLQSDARMVLIDGDTFEPGNASRMLFGRHGNKAVVTRNELKPRFRDSRLSIEAVKQFIRPENISTLIRSGDIVILCVDNHSTRHLVDEHCAKLKDICLISGGNDGVGKDSTGSLRRGTNGNVQVYVRKAGKEISQRISQYHPEIKFPKDKSPYELNCTELLISQPQILFANLAVASGICNALLLYLSRSLPYGEACFDIAVALSRPTIMVNNGRPNHHDKV